MYKKVLITSVSILIGISSLCSCSTSSTETSTNVNSTSFADDDIRYEMDRSADLKNISFKYSKYWKKSTIDGIDDEHYLFRMSVPDSTIFVNTEEPNSNSENPAKSYAEIYSKTDKEAEVVSFDEVRIDDKPGYKVLIRHYDDESNAYDDDNYDSFIVFEYKSLLYCVKMNYSKEEKNMGKIVLEDFINTIDLH